MLSESDIEMNQHEMVDLVASLLFLFCHADVQICIFLANQIVIQRDFNLLD